MWILPKNLHTSDFVPDTEALSLDLNESSQLCAQLLFVRSKPSPLQTWLQKWKRDLWTRHLFGRILKPSHGQSFVTAWTSSLAVTHASHSAVQAKDSEEKTQGTSGRLFQTALTFYDQESASLKMSRGTLPKGSITFCATWESWVIDRRGEYSQRLNVAHLTNENGFLSWPTIRVRQAEDCATERRRQNPSLDSTVKQELEHGLADPANPSTHGSRPESWATPRAADAAGVDYQYDQGNHAKPRLMLPGLAKAWATPEGMDGGKISRGGKRKDELLLTGQVKQSSNGKLNPRWVETLMGLPVGWTMPSCQSPATTAQTNCACSATELFQQQQP